MCNIYRSAKAELKRTQDARCPRFQPGAAFILTLKCLTPMNQWKPKTLSLYLAGDPASAGDLYLSLRHTARITLSPRDEDGESAELPPSRLTPWGFDEEERLLVRYEYNGKKELLGVYDALDVVVITEN